MKSKHHQSPWVAVAQGEANQHAVLSQIGDWMAFIQLNGELTHAEQAEIMNLIAAAPDLLEALKNASDLLYGVADENNAKGTYGRDCFDARKAAELAIHKATGGEHGERV